MLNLSLAEIERAPVRLLEEVPAGHAFWDGTGLSPKEPLSLDLVATIVGEGVLVRGTLQTVVEGSCRRCLTPVVTTISDEMDLLYEPLTEAEEEELGGEVYPLPPRGDDLDITAAVREQLLLRAPDFVVCSETCKGLCPQCGAELNRTTCNCVPEAAEGPWDALKRIKFD